MKVFIVHSVLRGKNDKSVVGIKIDKVFSKSSAAEEYAATLSAGEKIINGELVEIRSGITEAELVEGDN